MSKYDINTYHVIFFDEKGTKVKAASLGDLGLFATKDYCKYIIEHDECVHSYIILRVIDNSLD